MSGPTAVGKPLTLSPAWPGLNLIKVNQSSPARAWPRCAFLRITRAAILGDANSRPRPLKNNQRIRAVICKPCRVFGSRKRGRVSSGPKGPSLEFCEAVTRTRLKLGIQALCYAGPDRFASLTPVPVPIDVAEYEEQHYGRLVDAPDHRKGSRGGSWFNMASDEIIGSKPDQIDGVIYPVWSYRSNERDGFVDCLLLGIVVNPVCDRVEPAKFNLVVQ